MMASAEKNPSFERSSNAAKISSETQINTSKNNSNNELDNDSDFVAPTANKNSKNKKYKPSEDFLVTQNHNNSIPTNNSDNNQPIPDEDYLDPELIAIAQGRRSGRIRTQSKPFSLEYNVPASNKKKKTPASKTPSKTIKKPKTPQTIYKLETDDIISDEEQENSEYSIEMTKPKSKKAPAKASKKPLKKTPTKAIKNAAKPTTKLTTKATKEPKPVKIPAKDKKPVVKPIFSLNEIKELSEANPDLYWNEHLLSKEFEGPIEFIDQLHPLKIVPTSISDQGPITSIALSDCGGMLATFSSSGSIRIWDTTTFELLSKIRDPSELQIEEFYSGQFTPSGEHIIAAGKLKDRLKWSSVDDDNHIIPCPIKIFDVLTGECKTKLSGHTEEVICIKKVIYKNNNYLITTSQDGHIRKWPLSSDWVTPSSDSTAFKDGVTCMAFSVSFLPNCGNRFFMAACDERVKLFDMETDQVIQSFDQIYSSYCDSAKFIRPLEDLSFLDPDFEKDPNTITDDNSCTESKSTATNLNNQGVAYLLTRGVELLDSEDNSVSSIPNTVTLHKLVYPTEDTYLESPGFKLIELKRFHHDEYLSNSWLIRISSNGRYVLAPTYNGQVFVFHLATGKLASVLRGHQGWFF
ncbi:putative WD repeat-containing protein [Smittium culicis]|uniref:Putative WD repeat-containing protein n=1 Tax=Smittium culicis TaxID=133412 RepID=A0A1R1YAX9_9FUNG|nr:putative WD repeat-containing protein [Smittium culicis]